MKRENDSYCNKPCSHPRQGNTVNPLTFFRVFRGSLPLTFHKLRQLAQVFPQQRPQATDTVIVQGSVIFFRLSDDIAH